MEKEKEFETHYDYDFDRPVNIYDIKDMEVKRAFNLFTKSVMDIFSFEDRSRKNGAEDYGYYTYYIIDLAKKTRDGQKVDAVAYALPAIPEKFYDLLLVDDGDELGQMTKGAKLKEAQDEALQIIANYMAYKYKRDVAVMFDGMFFLDRYEPQEGIFNQEEYDRHIRLMMADGNEVGELASMIRGKAYNVVYAELHTAWQNGETTKNSARWDLESGEILEVFPNEEEEERNERQDERLLVEKQELVYGDIKEHVREEVGENGPVLYASTIRATEMISDRLKEAIRSEQNAENTKQRGTKRRQR